MTRKKNTQPDQDGFSAYALSEAVSMHPANIGSDFEDFLAEEGILEEVRAAALKRVIAFQLQQDMKEKGLTKLEVAKRMKTSRSQLDRILNPAIRTIQLDLIIRAATCVGRRFTLTLS